MDGPAFIRVLRLLNPRVRIIAVSGYQSKSSLPATWVCWAKPTCPNRLRGPCCCRHCSACFIRKLLRKVERSGLPGSAADDWLHFPARQVWTRTESAGKLKSHRQSHRLICDIRFTIDADFVGPRANRKSKSGGKHAAVQTLRAPRKCLVVAPVSGLRWLQHRSWAMMRQLRTPGASHFLATFH